ncbi:hypothetical protein TRFO_18367 [Tritrichomonas foetus]|uniref:RING-type domain-containing protein n=1 Tax=Tritrichomonas foetus TaxID=1144522 RepID=A0A1J4KM22_9EUKA|nr:hypothetical protein TRFO_18367 [Tritrichomonas foetus]|eukprot:OHT11984.1 hypothetical protein TRFO_18367 [Tritrichomonas foetus]
MSLIVSQLILKIIENHKMSEGEYPADIQSFINESRYADAIELCKQKSIPYATITEKVREMAEVANAELLQKKNPQDSIKIYITTIGVIEPSTILCRFFSPHLTRYLTQYLVELHVRGYAKEADTRLLFNLFHHKEEQSTLNKFIAYLEKSKEEVIEFKKKGPSAQGFTSRFKKDTIRAKFEVAAKVRFITNFKPLAAVETLVDNDMNDHALKISKIFGVSKQIIDIMINTEYKTISEKIENYMKAADMIHQKIDDPEGRALLLEFGPKLLRGDNETAKIVEHIAFQLWLDPDEHDDGAYLKLFWGCPKHCRNFLEAAIQNKPTTLFVNAYIELLIPNNYFFKDQFGKGEKRSLRYIEHDNATDPNRALQFINDQSMPINEINQLLFICSELNFADGIIALLRRKNRVSDITAIYIANIMTRALVEWVKSKPELDGEDWVSILRYFAAVPKEGEMFDQLRLDMLQDNKFLKFLLNKAQKARPLFSLIKELSANKNIQFDVIMNELNTEMNTIISQLDVEENKHRDLVDELKSLEEDIEKLEENDYEFKPMYCEKCNSKLTVPYVGFFCGHNLHLTCCNGEGDDISCPICEGKNTAAATNKERMPELKLDNMVTDLLDTTVKMIEGGYYSRETY